MTNFRRPLNPDGTMPPIRNRGFYIDASRTATWLGILVALGTLGVGFMTYGVPILEVPTTVQQQVELGAANSKAIVEIKQSILERDKQAEQNHQDEMTAIQSVRDEVNRFLRLSPVGIASPLGPLPKPLAGSSLQASQTQAQ